MDNNKPQEIKQLIEENLQLKNKIAFSIGALEGINYLLKNQDPNLGEQSLIHLRDIVNRVVTDLKNS